MNEATAEATNHPISHPEQPTTTTSTQVTALPPAHQPESGTSQDWVRAQTSLSRCSISRRARNQSTAAVGESRLIATKQGRKFWEANRYQRHKKAAATRAAERARIRLDFQHKVSTDLVRRYD